ncbi:MAG: aromatic amino acid lyase [Chloroflexi bacterium]|nr:aromatic amino acid lyase [Chloroflexota bacterium]
MLELNDDGIGIEEVIAVARRHAIVAPLSEAVIRRMDASRQWVSLALRDGDRAIYGVNHDVVRAMMLIRANTLAKGYSGARPAVAQTLIDMLNAGVTPFVPSKGSLGASGDLAPLAHIAVVLTRDLDDGPDYSGQAWHGGELLSGAEAMARAGIVRLIPEAKEGLALTNGTDFMVAAGALALYDALNVLEHAEVAAALSLEALLALSEHYHPALHAANGQPGQIKAASRIRALVSGSQLIDTHPNRVQDAYSLRCVPQVLGPVRDILAFLCDRFTGALNATSDNPLIFPSTADSPSFAVAGGNFHGQGPSLWLNFLGIAMASAGNIAERRVFRLLTPELSDGLPPMLVASSGIDSGLMISQYTAAALVSDNKTLAHPDSVDSIPSSANQEDFVSMGANAARHTMEIIENVRHIIAIELLTAAQAIDLRPDGPARLGAGTAAAYKSIRSRVTFLAHDRQTTPDIEALADLIVSGELLRAIRQVGDDVKGSL